MEFRDYAAHETSAVIARLLASQAEAQVQRAREALDAAARALDTTVAPVGAEEEARNLVQRLEAAAGMVVQRVQQDAHKTADALREELATARRAHDDAEGRLTVLQEELAVHADRAATAEADLDATIEAHRQIEGELASLRELLEATRREATRLASDLEAETAHRAILTADLSAAGERQAKLEADLAAARAAAVEGADRRITLENELEAARGTLAALEAARAALQTELGAARAASVEDADRRATLENELEAARGRLATHEASLAALQAELGAARAAGVEDADRRIALENELESARGTLAALETSRAALQAALHAELEAARAAAEGTRTELESTRADRDRARSETLSIRADLETARTDGETMRAELRAAEAALATAAARADRTPLIVAATAACEALGAAGSIADLLGGLATQVSTQFARAAIFRVKTHHLEGEHAVGFDAATAVSKLVVPLSLDSLVTRAHSSGALAQAGPGDPAASAPFGGEHHVAVAVPLTVQGEALAVLYADSNEPSPGVHDERPAFAALLAGHATALLARMSQELKTLRELSDYATMLLQEAEQMYAADLEAGRSDAERRHRLQDTIECARQLYTQRAALEGAAAASLLDEQIAAAAGDATPFASDLAALEPQPAARQDASRAS
jgi:chromosome segregation ATPase